MYRVREYIDRFFADYRMSDELYDLKDEITMNAQDRYNDYIAMGKSSEEAAGLVIESLGDLNSLMEEINASPAGDDFGGVISRIVGAIFDGGKVRHADSCERSFSDIRRIYAELKSADIEAEASPDADVHICAEGQTRQLHFTAENGSLRIREDSLSAGGIDRLKMLLPGHLDRLEIHNVNGDLYAEDISADEMIINAVNGDFDLTDIDFRTLSMAATNGDVDLATDCVFEKISIRTVNGDVDCRLYGVPGISLSANTLSGDIDNIKEYDSSHIVSVTTVSGDIDIS